MNHKLSDLTPGQTATVQTLSCTGSMRRRLLDLGLIDGTEVECLHQSPLGDPTAYLVRGSVIALRTEDSAGVLVSDIKRGVADGASYHKKSKKN